MYPFFYVNNNIAFLSFDLLRDNDLIPITDRIKDVLKTCNFGYSICGYYTSDCNGYFILHLNLEDQKKEIKTIHDLLANPNLITSVTKAIVFSNVIELYDVCTLYLHRNKGYMRTLMTELIKTFANKEIWLGVQFDNPSFEQITDFYVSLGFVNPERVMKTTQGTMLKKSVLSLKFSKYITINSDLEKKIKNKIKMIQQSAEMDMNKDYAELR